MEYRKLGRTGLDVSVIAFGGILAARIGQEKVFPVVDDAIARGVNLFDVGPTYRDAQNKLGPAIEKYRDRIILTCKTEPEKNKEEVRTDLEHSLQVLKTDFFDVYQLHEVTDDESLKKAISPGGALEAILEAREEGLVKYIGFSAHSDTYALKLMKYFDFDTVMFPINWNYWINYHQGEAVIQKAQETDKGILAIKALAQRRWKDSEERYDYQCWYKPLFDNEALAELALKFTLSKKVATAVCPGDYRMLSKSIDLVEALNRLYALSESEKEQLVEYAKSEGGQLYPVVL